MFKKLLKYDMLSVSRLWWIAAMIVPIATVVAGLLVRFLTSFQPHNIVTTLIVIAAGILTFICIMAVFLSFILTEVLVFVRFYKHLFTDEGYLTFTLPVSRKQIFFAKTVNAMIWFVVHGLLLVGAFVLFFVTAPGDLLEKLDAVGYVFRTIWDAAGAWTILFAVELVIWLLLSTLQGITMVHLCITIGAVIAKKAKVIAAIGIYYVMNYAFTFIYQLLFYAFVYGIIPGFDSLAPELSLNGGCTQLSLVLLIAICITGVFTTVLYNLTQFLLDRKLNLA